MDWSPEFVAFIREHIVSVEQIAVLLLLSDDQSRSFDEEGIRAALTSSTGSIRERLAVLRRRGLIEVTDDGRFRYRCDARKDRFVRELREEYARRPVRVIELIFSGRDDALESFSDAFRLGADDDRR